MDIVSEDLIRIIIFIGIVIWYILSLIKRAKKGRQEPGQKQVTPSIKSKEDSKIESDAEGKSIIETMFPELVGSPPQTPQIKRNIAKEDIYIPDSYYEENERAETQKTTKKTKLQENIPQKTTKQNVKKNKLHFSKNPFVQGIIFSEIIGKSKSQE